MTAKQALRDAKPHVSRQQHSGAHVQDRTDARRWMDDHGGGRCPCDRCVRDQRKFDARQP